MSPETQLLHRPFGVELRVNKAGQTQVAKNVQTFSIFDEGAFLFYLIKYSEHIGSQSLL